MKKRWISFLSAMVMVLSVSVTALAANSSSAPEVAQKEHSETEVLVTEQSNTTGQVLTEKTLDYFVEDTLITGVKDVKVEKVTTEQAKGLVKEARAYAGDNAFIATMIDLKVPEGTGKATFTLTCSNVWKGQSVTVIHLKSDGSFENIRPSLVEDNKITFTMNSYSPIAIVVNTSPKSPKTGEE